jgi:hypothetical protein
LTQLSSGNQNIVHSTLGLCIAMARVSKQYACDTYQKIMVSNNLFATLLQRGKTALWPINDNIIENDLETIIKNEQAFDSFILSVVGQRMLMNGLREIPEWGTSDGANFIVTSFLAQG